MSCSRICSMAVGAAALLSAACLPAAPLLNPIVVEFNAGGGTTAVEATAATAGGASPVNITVNKCGAGMSNLFDTAGGGTTISVNATGTGNGTNGANTLTGAAADLFPNSAATNFNYVGSGATGVYTFTGLDSSQQYTFDILGLRTVNTTDRSSTYSLQGANSALQTINSAGLSAGYSGPAHLAGITPDANGMITLTVTTSGAFAYVNAIELSSVPEPSSLALLGLGSLAVLRRRR